jgi:glycyl-tRNA synthetase beta chain
MSAADFLFELLCEELPPRTLLTLSKALCEGIVKGLDAKGVSHGAVRSFATPRRLAVQIDSLAARQPDRPIEKRGPPLTAAYDAKGAPTQAAIAFAKGLNVPVESLSKLTTDKGAWLHYRGTEPGAATVALLPDIVNQSLAALPIAKRMRWGSRSAEFVRPVHGAVLLFGSEIIHAEILGLATGRATRGHRFHAPQAIELKNPAEYAPRLEEAKVMADFAQRKEIIRAQVKNLAGTGRALIEEPLLEEVTALVEWPVAVQGRFDARFLKLPREVVIATIQDHQRYFAIEDGGALTNRFVTVSNIESKDPSKVVEGNERVVRPRLSDAAFFFEQDKKATLEEHAKRLAGMTFQTKLGSYADKTRRIAALAEAIGARIGTGTGVVQAASLCKADLMTAMVGEFPELQGTMGRYYGEAEGLPAEVSRALQEHYQPRFAGDAIPSSPMSQAVALADKLDTLVGIFAIEQRPTGAKDPFGLRRAALGVLRILLEAKLDLDLPDLLTLSAAAQPVKRASVVDEVYDFISERLRGLLAESAGASSEMLDAVLAKRPGSPLDATTRLEALKTFLELPEAPVLAALNKRISNILKKSEVRSDAAVAQAAFTEEAERALHAATLRLREPVEKAAAERRYADSLKALAVLSAPVNGFFDQVMVMDENLERRNNRLALLRDVQHLLGGVADLSKLPG